MLRKSARLLLASWLFAPATGYAQSDITSLLQEGEELVVKKRDLEEKFRAHLSLVKPIEERREAADLAMMEYNKLVPGFESACKRTFYQGEEAAYADCKREQGELQSRYSKAKVRQDAVRVEADTWKTNAAAIGAQYEQVKRRYASWERRVRVMKAIGGSQECLTKAPMGTPEEVVHAYCVCWDGCGQAGRRVPKAGSAFFNIPANSSAYDYDSSVVKPYPK